MARNKYPEATVEKILDVAERLFVECGYDSLCQTGVEEDSRLFWRSYRTLQGLKTNPFLSPGQK